MQRAIGARLGGVAGSLVAGSLIDPRRRGLHVAFVFVALLVHLATHYATFLPALREPLGNLPYFRLHVLHEAEFLVIIAYAAVVLGLRGGLAAVAITGISSIPFIFTPYVFGRDPFPNEVRDLAIQTGAILLMGVMLTVLYDRDKRRREAESRARSLLEIDQVRNNFVSMAAHELRGPLTTVAGFTDLLLKRDPPAAQRKVWLEDIRDEGGRLTSLIDELLSVARIESNTLRVEPSRLHLVPAINTATNAIGEPPSHAFILDMPADIPHVAADGPKLQQVLINLLSNAVKYSPAGGDITVRARSGSDGFVTVEVQDRGLGIPKEERSKLFTTFYRVSSPETAEIGGTGLGLFIVKSLIELMGGSVWIDSELGRGSTFGFTLRAWREDPVRLTGEREDEAA